MKAVLRAVAIALPIWIAVGCSDKGSALRYDIGAAPAIVLSATRLDFAASAAETDTVALTITNGGLAPLVIDSFVVHGSSDFQVLTAPSEVAPENSLEVDVVYAATSVSASAVLTIATNAPGSPASVTLEGSESGAPKVTFSADVRSILVANCALSGCHNSVSMTMGLDFATYASARAEVVPGSPDASDLYKKLQPLGNMPLGRAALSATDRQTIYIWIEDGALE